MVIGALLDPIALTIYSSGTVEVFETGGVCLAVCFVARAGAAKMIAAIANTPAASHPCATLRNVMNTPSHQLDICNLDYFNLNCRRIVELICNYTAPAFLLKPETMMQVHHRG
jgi:hypothetical protein